MRKHTHNNVHKAWCANSPMILTSKKGTRTNTHYSNASLLTHHVSAGAEYLNQRFERFKVVALEEARVLPPELLRVQYAPPDLVEAGDGDNSDNNVSEVGM